MYKNRMLAIVLLLTLILAACGGGGGGAALKDPPSASKPAADLRMTSHREIKTQGARPISLSPDGRWLLVDQGGVPCMYDTAPLTLKFCVDESDIHGMDDQSVAWSPDGARVAFTENFFQHMNDSDLWVLEVEGEKLANLTDDSVERLSFGAQSEGDPLVDVLPTWSPDGKKLLFARSAQKDGEWAGTVLYRISASGGKPERLQTIDPEMPGAVWPSMRWTRDGKKIVYTVYRRQHDDPNSGVWIAERDGKNPRHVLGFTDEEMGMPVLLDVSAQGDKALVWYAEGSARYASGYNVSYYVLLDLETGDVEPLKQASSEEPEFYSPMTAVFAPDGSKLLYTYRDIGGEFRLAVRDVEGGPENVLTTSEEMLGYSADMGLGLDWASDDTVYVGTPPSSGLLISLGAE